MSRQRKPTIREVQSDIVDMRQYLTQFTKAVSMDIHRLNVILFSYLKEVGKVEEVMCDSCGQEILLPNIEGIEKETHCPSCQKPLYKNQTSLNDYAEESE
jgi:formylmethanofuran dehydrogenase subunit E